MQLNIIFNSAKIIMISIFCLMSAYINAQTVDTLLQRDSIVMQGYVLDERKEGLDFASVVLMQDGKRIAGAKTDRYGHYILKNVSDGKYTLQVTYVGYNPYLVEDVIITSNRVYSLDIFLKKRTGRTQVQIIRHYNPRFFNASDPNRKIVTREQILHSPF